MKIELGFKKIKEVIVLLEKVANKHQTLPVLSCILFDVVKNGVILRATNLDIGVEIFVPAKSDVIGTFAVPAKTLSLFISQTQDQNQSVVIEFISGNLHIKTNKSKGVIKTVPVEDFPSIPKLKDCQEYQISPEDFTQGLTAVFYSASISNVKPELSSVYIYKDNENLTFVATDSFRLSEKKIKTPTTNKLNDILIPFKNIPDIIRVLGYLTSSMKVCANKNLISFENNGIYIVSRIIDGVFPDYRQIIPKSFTTEVVALKQDILNALKISNIFSDKFNQVHMKIEPRTKLLEIQTKNSDIGENQTHIDAALTGEAMEINFNYKYLIDGFQSINTDSVTLQFNGLNKPVVIKPVSGEQNFLYLVMPMNR
ncbi:MAG: DNA polymerase III subunit beta [Candidatus Taylorbacteria bacterium RIFCSPHIGHO2_02_FULL_45_28]|uniref:Beta sliding clamp n=1 Tax=Candidatus Taylorbacteria bacterium RIFCSPHIGHO2_12_FULL_45_16 TaxID=1802315 RepID=A0A1G2N0R5_9BACT|nr:MAG: DNA polymerase III subunit beta [Candidatus Taylorbacteria bacterium RIFCSPHIGHO2_01_FULL_44_110]OHA24909.1 MAG: DNA polymerase III subunit beta [Candidatus Taylorbacteria bacterium RIFCSPHIGHO2_02_FULL_45_28]OHA29727.1 MAG: DNA polymerase III subunit beta [Candidatus Taylorbacteria bacterium RIFCSPHIGHO2_12_FULL_45_16]OHA32671.1 MAG: DNA polymerase III subunit beta [Candidatus Taylorbacteria bacterium RIFCSPLOWO2_01_FULL_45_59]OHA38826.1 MAG: DNA polymerase III subunit beta [Candidatus